MTAQFTPTPDNCTIDGYRPGVGLSWDRLDWPKAEWREQSTLMLFICGPDEAPPDPHWSVPHVNGETFHRVRKARKRKSPPP